MLLLTTIRKSYSYFLSRTELQWYQAEDYCVDVCDSTIASIHSWDDFHEIFILIESDPYIKHLNTNNTWIGLKFESGSMEWHDGTDLDWGFGSNLGTWVWGPNEPSSNTNDDCIELQFVVGQGWRYFSDACWNNKRFVCNDCPYHVLEKYILPYDGFYTFDAAETRCNDFFGTHLISIHSYMDDIYGRYLCEFTGPQNIESCWMGLNDRASDGTFVWTDGTTWDYGTEIVPKGIEPWAVVEDTDIDGKVVYYEQPDNHLGTDDCVHFLYGDRMTINGVNSGDWNDDICDAQNTRYLCNAPSSLCDESEWLVLSGIWTFGTGTNECEVWINTKTSNYIKYMGLEEEKWNNIAFEYIWTFSTISNGSSGIEIGIASYDEYNVLSTYPFYIGVSVTSNGAINQLFIQYNNIKKATLDISEEGNIDAMHTANYISSGFRQLRVTLNETGEFSITWNDAAEMVYVNDNIFNNYYFYIDYIALKNVNKSSHSKALWINGVKSNEYSFNLTQYPTLNPTINPTTNPTILPTIYPTTEPTEDPTTSTPTTYPTTYPTIYPTYDPSTDPTDNPSNDPTVNPITNNPTTDPISLPTVTPTEITRNPTIGPTQKILGINEPTHSPLSNDKNGASTTTIDKALSDDGNESDSDIIIIMITLIAILSVLICMIGIYMLYKQQKRKQEKQIEAAHKMAKISQISRISSMSSTDTGNNNKKSINNKKESNDYNEGNDNYIMTDNMMDDQSESAQDHKYINNITPNGETANGGHKINDIDDNIIDDDDEIMGDDLITMGHNNVNDDEFIIEDDKDNLIELVTPKSNNNNDRDLDQEDVVIIDQVNKTPI